MTLHRLSVVLALFVSAAAGWRAPGQPLAPAPDSLNAAERYLWVSPQIDPELPRIIGWTDIERGELGLMPSSTHNYTLDQLRGALLAHQQQIGELIAVTKLEVRDLRLHELPIRGAVDPADPRSEVLRFVRDASRLLRVDAWRCWSEGDRDGAVERIVALIDLGRHLGTQEGRLIDHLVASSLLDRAFEAVKELRLAARDGGLSKEHRAALCAAAARLPADDPCGIRGCWRRHRQQYAEFVQEQLRGDQPGLLLMYDIGQLRGVQAYFGQLLDPATLAAGGELSIEPGPASQKAIQKFLSDFPELTVDRMRAALEEAQRWGDAAEGQWDDPAADPWFKRLGESIDEDRTSIAALVLVTPRQLRRDWMRRVQDRQEVAQLCEGASRSP